MKKSTILFSIILLCVFGIVAQAQESLNMYAKVKRLEGQGNGGNWLNMTEATRNSIMSGAPWKVQDVEYEAGTTPVLVRVYNPVDLKDFDYRLKINSIQNPLDNSLLDSSAHWTLEWFQNGTLLGSYVSQYSIGEGVEEFVGGHGIAIIVKNHPFMVRDRSLANYITSNGGETYRNNAWYAQPDLVGSLVRYSGGNHWLGGVQDADIYTPGNWIRAGNAKATAAWHSNSVQSGADNNYMLWRKEDFFNLYTVLEASRGFMDFLGQYEHIANGTWAPYVMSSPYDGGPKANYFTPDVAMSQQAPTPNCYSFTTLEAVTNTAGYNQTLSNLYSVDIVLTPDKTKWTRALVLESGSGTAQNGYQVTQNFNGQTYYNIRHEPKTCPSVDKNGNPDNSGTTGFGWFPGYAINVETGERLNIMFAENSEDEYNHGNDMIFNPTNVYAFKKDATGAYVLGSDGQPVPMSRTEYDSLYLNIYEYGLSENFLGEPLNGGRHYVYVCGSSGNTSNLYYRDASRQRSYNDNDQTISVMGQTHGSTFTGTDGQTYPYYECGVYDEGKWLDEKFKTFISKSVSNNVRKVQKMQLFNNVMWTSIPMPAQGQEQNWLSNDATVQIRMSRPYMFYTSAVGTGPESPTNQNAPVFSFKTNDLNVVQNVLPYHIEEDIIMKDNRIDVNNVDAPVSPYSGAWFFDIESHKADFFVPKGSPKTPCFSYSFWMGGLDDADSLHVTAERFHQIGYDSWPGPLSLTDASVDNATMTKWNRTFKITRADVTECIANYQDPEYVIPQRVREWPAHGDTTKGQAWLLAPFVDVDNNNVYEPEHGDYPNFPGDMAQFVIFNDNYAQHSESGGAALGTETHLMVYAYDSPGDTIMNNTIFLKYKIFNRSQNNYHDSYIGLWSDWDLGYFADDYVGCDIMKNTAFCYNGSEVDGSGQEWAYDGSWPVQTLTLLTGPLMPSDSSDNPEYSDSADCTLFSNNGFNDYAVNGTFGFGDGIVDNERYGLTGFIFHENSAAITGDPQEAIDYYNMMKGIWRDGAHLKYGANGHPNQGAAGPDCRFMFYGDSDSPCNFATYGVSIPDSVQIGNGGWTESNVGNYFGDRRGLASVGPFNLAAGDMQEFEICLTTIPHEMAVTRGVVSLAGLQEVNSNYRDQVFVPAVTYVQHQHVCEGETYTFFDQECSETGLYRHWIRNADYNNLEPDTVYLLYLTNEPLYTLIYAAILPQQGYNDNGFNISPSETAQVGTTMYTMNYTSAYGCDSSVVLLLDIRMDAGVEDHVVENNFKLYPNPTTQFVTVEVGYEKFVQKHEYVMVFDINGKLMQRIPLTSTREQIDLSSYPSGVYVVKVGRCVGKVIKK